LVATVEQNGDPCAVMIPTAEIIRFYYATSTRLAQALFWGEYDQTFKAERSGVFEEGVVRLHLRRWLEDQDAWTLAALPILAGYAAGSQQAVSEPPNSVSSTNQL
jgi:hypothetical protein